MVYCLLAAVVLLPIAALALLSVFSRRPENLGVHDGRLAPCPDSPNCVCSQSQDASHHVDALTFNTTPETAWRTLQSVLAETPQLKVTQQTDDYIACESTSRVFRFVDDVEFLLDRAAGSIHVRSASRVGHSDLGVNRARVEAIRQRFHAALK